MNLVFKDMKIMESIFGGLFGGLKLKFFSGNNNKKNIINNTVSENSNINQNIGDTHYHFSENKITVFRQKVDTYNDFFKKLNKANISNDLENVIKYFNQAEAYYYEIKESHKYHEFVKEFPQKTQREFCEFLIGYYKSIGLGHTTKTYEEKLNIIKSSS